MFRTFIDLCIKTADRMDYLITLVRLGIHDRLAGPMPELLTDRVIHEDTESLRQAFTSPDVDDPTPPLPRSGGFS
jgi:hypothetical protein